MNTKRILWIVCLFIPMLIHAQERKDANLNIVYIGNSITQGVLLANPGEDAPPVQTSFWLLHQSGINQVELSNQGVSGSTTVDFLPAGETLFPKVKKAADALIQRNPKGTSLFSIMLGTNDSAVKGPNGSPVSPIQYYTNMKVIVDELLSLYPKAVIVLHRPVWYSPNTYNGAIYLGEGLQRLTNYYPQLEKLVGNYQAKYPNQVFMGDIEAFDYFKKNYETDLTPENGNAGTFYLHPNKKGAAKLGEYWGKAIYKAVVQ